MTAWFESGHVVDLIMALLLVEAVALAIWRRSSNRGVGLIECLPTLLSGLFLLAALRLALRHGRWFEVAAALFAALLAHLADLGQRARAKRDR